VSVEIDDYSAHIVQARKLLNDIESMCLHGVVKDDKRTYALIEEEAAWLTANVKKIVNWATEKKLTAKW
jgi:hypothetical protein